MLRRRSENFTDRSALIIHGASKASDGNSAGAGCSAHGASGDVNRDVAYGGGRLARRRSPLTAAAAATDVAPSHRNCTGSREEPGVEGAEESPDTGELQVRSAGGNAPFDNSAASDLLVIHVRDDVRRMQRDFTCSQSLLLRHMKYFDSYLKGVTSTDDVDISVHCDIGVFEWLLEYMEKPSKIETLDANSVVSILISSEFLQMHGLVDSCLAFMKKSIDQVLRLPLDLGCLSEELVRRLAALFTDEELDLVRDRRDRLLGRLFAHKLEELLTDEDNILNRCMYCHRMFIARHKERTTCERAKVCIDFHGMPSSKHAADDAWAVGCYVQHCHEHLRMSWKDIYWRMWGHLQLLQCGKCHRYFSATELEHCSFHPEDPVWYPPPRAHTGVFPCCQQPAKRLDPVDNVTASGCCAREHVPTLDDAESMAAFDKILRHRASVCIAYADREKDLKVSADVDEDACSRQEVEDDEEEDSDSHRLVPAYWRSDMRDNRCFDWYCLDPPPEHSVSEAICQSGIANRSGRASNSSLGRGRRRKATTSKNSSSNKGIAAEDASFFDECFVQGVPPQKKIIYRMDVLREDDRRMMASLVERLHSQRDADSWGSPQIAAKSQRVAWVGSAAAADAAQQASRNASGGVSAKSAGGNGTGRGSRRGGTAAADVAPSQAAEPRSSTAERAVPLRSRTPSDCGASVARPQSATAVQASGGGTQAALSRRLSSTGRRPV